MGDPNLLDKLTLPTPGYKIMSNIRSRNAGLTVSVEIDIGSDCLLDNGLAYIEVNYVLIELFWGMDFTPTPSSMPTIDSRGTMKSVSRATRVSRIFLIWIVI